jgi:hypothetical protein
MIAAVTAAVANGNRHHRNSPNCQNRRDGQQYDRQQGRVAAKKAARQAKENNKTETEDEEWGGNVLNAMINKLGTRKEVEEDIRDHPRKPEFAQRLANFSDANEDGNPMMMTKNAT